MGKLYANTKIFHFRDRLEALASGHLPSPVHIRLKPTNRCNHRCHYCCYRNDSLLLGALMREEDQVPWPRMRELVKELKEIGVRAVTFSGGGEPLCYPHITDTVKALSAAGIKVAMLTNGGLLRDEVAELLALRATWIRVSMDACEAEGYAASRGVGREEFAKVCDNLRNFAAIPGRKCVLGLNLIVTRDNSSMILDFLKMARELGVDHVKVSGVVVSTDPAVNNDYHRAHFSRVKEQLNKAHDLLASDRFTIIDLFHEPVATVDLFRKDYHWCPMCRFLLVIGADQQVYTCQDKAYTEDGRLGSLVDRPLKEMWHSEETARRLQDLDPSQHCRHHCVAHNKNLMLLDYLGSDLEHLEFV